MHSTCRDLLRFGMLFAQHGNWDGEQLLPAEWVDAAVGGSSQELNAGYGYLWWLNRPGQVVDAQGGTSARARPRRARPRTCTPRWGSAARS